MRLVTIDNQLLALYQSDKETPASGYEAAAGDPEAVEAEVIAIMLTFAKYTSAEAINNAWGTATGLTDNGSNGFVADQGASGYYAIVTGLKDSSTTYHIGVEVKDSEENNLYAETDAVVIGRYEMSDGKYARMIYFSPTMNGDYSTGIQDGDKIRVTIATEAGTVNNNELTINGAALAQKVITGDGGDGTW